MFSATKTPLSPRTSGDIHLGDHVSVNTASNTSSPWLISSNTDTVSSHGPNLYSGHGHRKQTNIRKSYLDMDTGNQLDAFCCLLPGHVIPSLVDTFVPVLRCRMVPLGSMDHVMHTEFSLSTSSISSLGWKLVGSRVSKCPSFPKTSSTPRNPQPNLLLCVEKTPRYSNL